MGARPMNWTPGAPKPASAGFIPPGQQVSSLHDAEVQSADTPPVPFYQLHDPSITTGKSLFYFRDHAFHLKREILKADLVLGCVAWLTDPTLLRAMRTPEYGCAMVVQKEDFLRTDTNGVNQDIWETNLHRMYDALHCSVTRYDLPGIVSKLSVCGDPSVHPVRCVGNHNSNKSPSVPRMHNKFAVFCKVERVTEKYSEHEYLHVQPYAYWTGSLNWTRNAELSFENSVLVYDERVAEAAALEWGNIFSLSEPLDWDSPWVAPEYRIGS